MKNKKTEVDGLCTISTDEIANRTVMLMCKLHNIFIYDVDDDIKPDKDGIYRFSSSLYNFEMKIIDNVYVLVYIYNTHGLLLYTLHFELNIYKNTFIVWENAICKHYEGHQGEYMKYENTGVSIIKSYYKNDELVYAFTKEIEDIYNL